MRARFFSVLGKCTHISLATFGGATGVCWWADTVWKSALAHSNVDIIDAWLSHGAARGPVVQPYMQADHATPTNATTM